MSRHIRAGFAVAILAALASCGPSKFKTYHGPPVTFVEVNKSARQMLIYSGEQVIGGYNVSLGHAPEGHKQFSGDGKTPEGVYYIDRRNPESNFHLSIGINYPNPQDASFAFSQGKNPGGDIFIHGRGPHGDVLAPRNWDWTDGCIAVTDAEIEDIYAMVRDGTPVRINP